MGYAMKKSDNVKAGQIVKPANAKTLLAKLATDSWAAATDAKRRIADARMAVLSNATQWVKDGASVNSIAKTLHAQMQAHMSSVQRAAISVLDNKVPSLVTLKRWLKSYKQSGKAGLLPDHTGRQRLDYGWEARAIELYNLPSKPNAADVAYRLIAEGFDEVKIARVRTYLASMPATLGKHSPARIGKRLHHLQRGHHNERDMRDLSVGDIYVADGHTCDCYVAHPKTGGLHRPELTVFLDLKSRYPVGFWISESESTTTTLFALSNALTTHNHVPLFVYVDRGSGYISKLMTDEVVGFYNKFSIQPIFSLPANPHGKGWIERFFKTIRNRHDKFFGDGQFYCGDDMSPDTNRRLSTDTNSGRRVLRSLAEYIDSLKAFMRQYIQTAMPVALGGQTPAQVFSGLQRVELGVPMDAVARPSVTRTITRMSVTLDKRRYHHNALALFDAQMVRVEYDMHDDQHVWISAMDGRHICVADIVQRMGVVSKSRIQDQEQVRLKGQIKRLDKRADEARERATPALDADDLANQLELSQSIDLLDPLPERKNRFKRRIQKNQRIIDLNIYDE